MAQKNNPKSGRTLQGYILRRVFPIVMVVFVALGLVGAAVVQSGEVNELTLTHQASLNQTIQQILDEEFEIAVDDLDTLAQGSAALTFAREAERITKTGVIQSSGLIEGQLSLLRDFLSIVNSRANRYVAVRYLMRAGLIWSEVTNLDGIQATNSSFQQGAPISQLFLTESLALSPGSVGMELAMLPPRNLVQSPIPVFRFSAPVADDASNIFGVIQLDVMAEPVAAAASSVLAQAFGDQDGRRLLIVNHDGEYLIDSSTAALSYFSPLATGQTLSLAITEPRLNQFLNANPEDLLMESFGDALISVRRITLQQMPDTGWQIVLLDEAGSLPGRLNTLAVGGVIGGAAAGLLMVGAIGLILRRTLKPLESASAMAQQLAGGRPADPTLLPQSDPMGGLFDSFERISQRMTTLSSEMTLQADRNTRNLEIAARISRETATLSDVDELMNRAIDLICKEYGFYHAQVFLVDDIGQDAVLVYSHGDIGERLLEKEHRLPVGSRSVIGTVTATGQPVIVNNTEDDTAGLHSHNPLLPNTRAEMALPLQVGGDVIGALDIQSTEPDVFRQDETRAFQLLADQVAIALHNARLLIQSQQRINQIDTLNRQLTRVAWEDAQAKIGFESDYRYDLMAVEPGTIDEDGVIEALSTPIAIRGEVIGTLAAAAPEGESFTEGDQMILKAIAERVALAIENARLFQETQTSLAETSTLYQMSRFLNEADSLDDLISAIVRSMMSNAISGQIWVFDEYPTGTFPEWLELAANWTVSGDQPANPVGKRLYIPDSHFLSNLSSAQPTLIYDTARDMRLDEELRMLFEQFQARAVVLVPFSVRGVWRGLIMVEFSEPRQFSEREGRIYSALTDQAGVAIDNRLLLQQTEMTLSQIEHLYVASRIINTAQDLSDLVRAAVSATDDTDLNFGLGLLEGELDSTGWPTQIRVVAESDQGQVSEQDRVEPFPIPVQSPLRHREPEITVDDGTTEASPAIERLRQAGSRFMAVFPLFSVNQPIAIFYATSPEVRELSPRDFEVYFALTGQMSTFLEKRRLAEKTDQALDETRRLYAASRAIASAQDFNAVYAAAVEHLADGSPMVSRIAIFLAGPDPVLDAPYVDCVYGWRRAPHSDGDNGVGLRINSDAAPFGQMIRQTGGTVYFKHLEHDLADQPRLKQALQRSGETASVIVSSIQSRAKWFGVLICESETPDAFTGQYIRYAQAITDQVAIAVENQQLFEEAQIEAQRALALAEVGQLATRIGSEFEQSIDEVFARVAEPANYDRWLLMLVSEESPTQLTSVAQRLPAATSLMSLDLSVAEHSLADAMRYNKTILVNAPANYPAFTGAERAYLEAVGKHVVTPIRVGGVTAGAMLVGRRLDAADLDERDEQLVNTLAAQVAVAVENRRLFQTAENERQFLRSLLDTMPSGVLVLDPISYKPVQANKQVELLLQHPISSDEPFAISEYNLYRTGTNVNYPEDELPIFAAARTNQQVFSDDLAVIHADGTQTDLLMNAIPLHDARGNVSVIVAALQDISNLRGLENALQDNLQETIALYEATRSLSEANELDEVLDTIVVQLAMVGATDGYIVLLDQAEHGAQTVRALAGELHDLPEGILQARQKLFIENVNQAPELDVETRVQLVDLGIRSLMSVPLLARGRDVPLGWLVAAFDEPHPIRSEEERFLNTLGDSAATALDNRNLFQRTETALQETAAIYNATTAISRAGDMNDLAAAMQAAFMTLSPDWYAGYLMMSGATLNELLADAPPDAEPINFRDLIERHDLMGERSIFIEDLVRLSDPDPLEQELQANGHIRALASVSLRVKDAPQGRLFLGYRQPRRFTEGDVRYLNAIVDSAAVIIDNIVLFDQIQNALEETSVLYQASRSLANATTPQEILDAVINQMIQPHITHVFMALLGSSDWHSKSALVNVVANWQPEGVVGVNLQGVTLTADQFPAWNQLATPSILAIDDVTEDENLDPMERVGIESLDARSLAVIPLRATNRPIGAIWLGSNQPHRHTDRELRVYQAFAEQASLSMEATRLLEQTGRRARQLAASADVSQAASSILDINVLLPRVVDLIREVFNYDHVQVFLMDNENRFAELRASTGEAGQQLLAIKHKLERGSASVIGTVTERGTPVVALDTADASVVHRPNPYLPLTRSEMALPLIIKGKVVGALDVQSNQSNAFSDEDVSALTVLAAQIAVAIDNARLFEQSERRASDMSFLFTVATVAASAETLSESLQNVAELLRDSLESLSISIYLPKEYEDQEGNAYTVIQPVALAGSDQPLSEIMEVRLDDADNLLSIVATSFEPTLVADILADSRYLPVAASARSAVVVPLVLGTQFIGMIAMEDERPYAYDQDTLTLLLTLAGTLSAIIQNAQLLEQVQQTNEQLRELDRLKSDFLANMSHELRTPLNSIIGFSRVILKGIDGPLTEMQEQDLNTIYNSGQHLLGLINDILDQAKIASGKMDLQLAYFDIKPVIEGVRSIGIGLVKDKPINIVVDMASGLPKAFGDEFRTRQVLLNLVSNATKFTQQGSVTIQAYVEPDPDSGQPTVRIDVTDTGIGIAEQDMPLLFEAFRQIDSSLTRTVGGTGLGLPIAKSLVEMQGGRMLVKSQVNVGSTFSITIPTEEPVTEEEETTGKKKTTGSLQTVVSEQIEEESPATSNGVPEAERRGTQPMVSVMPVKRQVLLIEDNPDMVDQYRRAIQREGFDVFTASIPLEAEAMASGLRPTLIVMDVNFADGAGWNILARLKERDDTFDVPVIVVSLTGEAEKVMEAGAFAFLQRPFMPEKLVELALEAERESNTERILIIDDQPDSTRLLKQLLDEHGHYRVFEAHNGIQGVSMVARRRPDLVILDLRMPEMDGFAVLRELRSNHETANIPVLVVTGDTLNADEHEQLADIEVMFKTEISQEEYQRFIRGVRDHLSHINGDDNER